MDNIPSGTGNGAIISKYDMSYNFSTNTTTITDIDGNQSVYKFDENCNLCLSYKIKNNKVSEYKKYEYTKYFKYVIKNAKRSLLNKYSLDNFSFTEGDSQSSSLNFINKKTNKIKKEIV